MNDIKSMLRAVINGQSAMKEELMAMIDRNSVDIRKLGRDMNSGFQEVNKRLDRQGKSIAYLEDDAPTKKDFDELVEVVDTIKQKIATA